MNLDRSKNNGLRKENNWMTIYDCMYISMTPTKLRNSVFFFFYVVRNASLWIRVVDTEKAITKSDNHRESPP